MTSIIKESVMSTQTNQQYWQEQLEQCQALGLSGAAYCKQHHLSYHKFVYWRKKLSECGVDARPSATISGFVKVVPTQLAAAKLTLLLPDGNYPDRAGKVAS